MEMEGDIQQVVRVALVKAINYCVWRRRMESVEIENRAHSILDVRPNVRKLRETSPCSCVEGPYRTCYLCPLNLSDVSVKRRVKEIQEELTAEFLKVLRNFDEFKRDSRPECNPIDDYWDWNRDGAGAAILK
jgi:hypothetical protein